MKKVIIIGAGISGLSIAQILKDNYEVQIFEKDNRPGGLIKCDCINGHLFHRTGGHVFNTKRSDVLNWFWNHFDKEKEFIKAERNSVVSMENGQIIPYPIENHVYLFKDELMKEVILDLIKMSKEEDKEPQNFEEFLLQRFGNTLYREYFRPYNEKIWNQDLKNVSLSWLEGKLPMPSLSEIIYNNFIHLEEKQFVHSTFYYEKEGGSQFIANRLAENLNIRYGITVNSIVKTDFGWEVNGEKCDLVIFCGNVKFLPNILKGININDFHDNIKNLEAHGTTSVLCEIDDNPYSWIYMPGQSHRSHRIICTGNFSPFNRSNGVMSGVIEFTDYLTKDEIINNLSEIPFNPKYITHNFEKYTYPIQSQNTRGIINSLKEVLEENGFYLLGRFAEWEYYNMDVAMGAALDLSKNKF